MKNNERYESARHTFSSYFLTFGDKMVARLALMQRPDVYINPSKERAMIEGFAHIAIAVGSKENVDLLTAQLNTDAYAVVG